jgi:hypothetical protein
MKKQGSTLTLTGLLAGLAGAALAQTPSAAMTPNLSVNSTDQTYLTGVTQTATASD